MPDQNSAPREIAHRIRAIRRARNLTLFNVARQCGISTATLSRIETGKQDLAVSTLLSLCAALHCLPNDVLTANNEDPHGIVSALADVERIKAAFKAAGQRIEDMENRLRLFGKVRVRKRAHVVT